MQRLIRNILIVLCLTTVANIASAQASQPIKGVVRVKLQPDIAPAVKKAYGKTSAQGQPLKLGITSIDATLAEIKGVKMRPVFPCPKGREAEHAKYGLDLWYEIAYDESVDPLMARTKMQSTAGVQCANARIPMKLFEEPQSYRLAQNAAAPARAATNMPYNDPRLPMQWHYNNDGSLNGARAGADINLFKAWEITSGSSDVVVAIVDGGIDTQHEDLADAMWVNGSELNGTPGVDDDGNGFVDDIYGFNFCTFTGEIYPHTHGTHVAGTVGAVNNNGKGVSGVAGGDGTPGSGVRLMSCQVFDSRSGSGDGDFAAALVYAADMGATIAQCSWGWDGDGYYEQDVLDAVRYFTNTARSSNMTGGLCIFAAGNTANTGRFYPCCMDEVIAVSSICYDLTPAPYSCYGDWVDVAAPGGNLDYDQAQGILSTLPNNTYGYNEGTSMATPHVSGIAALILSKYGSPSLINETVRQQLVTSVNDLYATNPKAEGMYGTGYIDAWKALQWGDGSAPSAVTDLRAIAAQDNVQLTWTIPASSDNNVNCHIIYYSDKPFTASDTEGCKTEIVDTKFCISGDEFTHEVGSLAPMTTYYFGIVAVDRWSNSSGMSPIVEATTNEGPKMTLSRTAMNIKCNDGETWTSSTFDIGNTASGLLRWKAYTRTFSSAIASYSAAKGLMTRPYSGQIAGMAYTPANNQIVAVEDFTREDYPKEFTNCASLYAYIGESDAELTNSMAQLFTVDAEAYPDGFNLTHVNIEGGYGKNPVIEIYRNGGTLSSSTLLQSTEVSNEAPYYTDLALNEAVYFAAGESFYVVVHFKEGSTPNYPLGLGLSNGNSAAVHAYMSTDLGQTWTLLSEVLKGTNYETIADRCVWDIRVKSKFPDWSSILTLTPDEGQLEGGENTQTVTVSHNGTKIPDGAYRARIHFDTNETNPSGKTINVNISVDGNEPDVSFSKIVQFGNVLVGQKKTITVEVTNKGYGSFAGGTTFAGIYSDKISSTSDQFLPPAYLLNGIPSRSTVTFDITFAPTREGSHFGQIKICDIDGHELCINVQGAATEPAKISADPQEIGVGDIDAFGDDKEVTFKIKNDGNYPLQWVMPKYTDEELDEVASSSTHRFGYSWISNLYGSEQVAFTGAPQLVVATDVCSQLGDYDYFSDPIDIGFKFPFYGKTYDRVYISSLGMLCFDTYNEGTIYSPVSEDSYSYLTGLGVISAYGYELGISPATRIEYGISDGKFTVVYKDVLATVYAEETTPISFHIALSPSGDIEIGYDDYTAAAVFQGGKNLWVGIVDPDMEDPLTVTSSNLSAPSAYEGSEEEMHNRWKLIGTGTEFALSAPRPDMVKTIKPTSGIVPPHQAIDVTATVGATDEMYIGETSTNLVIQSNDVANPTYLVTFNANVVGDLKAELRLSADDIDFGRVFRTATAQQTLSVQNSGRNYLTINSVSIAGNKFGHNFLEPAVVAPGQSKDIVITIPTAQEGEVSDVLTVDTSAGTREVELKGEVIGVPQASLSYETLESTVPYGESLAAPLTITNSGNEELTYSLTPGSHITYTPEIAEGASVSYKYVSSLDDASCRREWYDIETTGLGRQLNYTYFLSRDVVPVELPFEFSYYGKKYSKMYIYDSGFVCFTEHNDEGIWPAPPVDFPQGSVYNNLIAPYWGLHTMDISSTAGVFYYVNDQEAVVSFIEYGNSMNIGIDYQVVIRADGTFTFNYKAANNYATLYGVFGVAGISDPNDQGVRLPERYIALGSNVDFYPLVECTLAPGESSVADIKLVADQLAGTYESKITLDTNVPLNKTIEIPVTLNITGEAQPVFPEDIVFEQVSMYQDTNYEDELIGFYGSFWYVPIVIRNDGAAAFTIESIDVESPKYEGSDLFRLYWYDMTGTQTSGWSVYDNDKITIGRSQLKLAIPASQYDYSAYAWQTPGIYDVKLTLHLSGLADTDTKEINVKIIVTEQPTIAFDKDEIRITNADDRTVEQHTLNILNTNGAHSLSYSIYVDPTGVGEEPLTAYSAPAAMTVGGSIATDREALIASALSLQQGTFGSSISTADVGRPTDQRDAPDAEEFPYLRALYYPAHPSNMISYCYGSNTKYSTYTGATEYTGPEGGFNISHVYTLVHPYGIDNKDVTVEIYGCDPQTGTDVLGRGTFNIGTVTSQLYQTVLYMCTLERPVYISEGQKFWVVITYPSGSEWPAGLILKQDAVESNRYMGYVDTYGWFDVGTLFSENYGSLGYISTCIETIEGGSWVKLLDADGNTSLSATGEIAMGQSQQINLQISPSNASKEKGNKAVLVVKSNDPKNPLINFPIYLDKNSAPAITIPKHAIAVNEGESARFEVTVTEPEGEDMVIEAIDNGAMCTLVSATSVDGSVAVDGMTATVSGASAGVKLTFETAPQFGDAGEYMLTVIAKDANNHEGKAHVSYRVAHVNRSPVAVAVGHLTLEVGDCTAPIDLATLFSDPDGDTLTYTIECDNDKAVRMYSADASVILEGISKGVATITAEATDPYGAKAMNEFKVFVGGAGIDEAAMLSGLNVYPNPVEKTLYIESENDIDCKLLSTNGSVLIWQSYSTAEGSVHAMDVGGLPSGVYLLQVTASDGISASRLVIKN